MQIAGVIAEYNPFHDGHAYHLRQTRLAGADAVVVVMSGNYVQRGTPAILSKWARAEAAAKCGADLVLELPVPWAIGRAQTFADGAVSVLHALGLVDVLSFGSECGDLQTLEFVSEILQDPALYADVRRFMDGGTTFAAAREQAVRARFGDRYADVLQNPNDTLCLEYLRAAKALGAAFRFLAVPRVGAHDTPGAPGFMCASEIRARLADGQPIDNCPACMCALWAQYADRGEVNASLRFMEREILSRLRTADPEWVRSLPDVSEGLENRLIAAAKQAHSLDELYSLVKTKRYSHARIRRIVLSAFLDIPASAIPPVVPYVRVLAIGEKGAQILCDAKQTCRVPILARAADSERLDPVGQSVFDMEKRAGELYAFLTPGVSTDDAAFHAMIRTD